jgi:N-acetylated-alpha-linked acidic dipeptidase
MLEVIRIIGLLKGQGWRPLRSIIFASWDAKEYNMIGSTEFVEDRITQIRKAGVAYLNVDAGVSGPDFHASASPLFHRALTRVIDRVSDPINNQTIRELWDSQGTKLESLGSTGDYVPFQELAGTTSIDFGFSGNQYPSASCYETYEWMVTTGDPGLQYHNMLAQVWVLLILELSQDFLIPFGLFDYVNSLSHHLGLLKQRASDLGSTPAVDFTPIDDSIADLRKAASLREDWEVWWFGQVYGTGVLETNALAELRRKHNNRISDFETDLLDLPGADEGHPEGQLYGLPGREQFKHVVFGPSIGDGSEAGWFPFVRDAVEAKDWGRATEMIRKTAKIISKAASFVGVQD